MKTYWWTTSYHNFGDELTPVILKHFLTGEKIELAKRNDTGKLLAVGSIMAALREGDIVWGSGSNQPNRFYNGRGCRFLAFRGPLTRDQVKGIHKAKLPEIYGDPGILLPQVYNPKIKKTHKVGFLPHYVDKKAMGTLPEFPSFLRGKTEPWKIIDILAPWKEVVREVLSCELIISSSLHGIICAEAYGIPAVWAKYTDKIRGGDYKFQDYFLGTGRERQRKWVVLPPIEKLAWRQGRLLGALETL